MAQLELDFNSVERIGEYLDVQQEAPAIVTDHRPPAYWPSSNGQLVVENLVVKYAPNLTAVLHNLSFTIKPCEKIGVVRLYLTETSFIPLTDLNDRSAGLAQVCRMHHHPLTLHAHTATGKSTLALSLLRMVEPNDGRIMQVCSQL